MAHMKAELLLPGYRSKCKCQPNHSNYQLFFSPYRLTPLCKNSTGCLSDRCLPGRKTIRYSADFQPEGTNVNFITPTPECIKIATYERGVENETLACGTGCVAAALTAARLNHDKQNTYTLKAKGGILKVSFKQEADGTFTNIWLEGPAEQVFTGEIEIKESR